MYEALTVALLVFAYAVFLFFIALYGEQGGAFGKKLVNSPLVYALALAVYSTTWSFYGAVGSAATSGALFITIVFGPTLAVGFWWFVLRKLVRIKNVHRITSVADFISSRYNKSPAIAAVVTLIALVGTTPYIALQLKSVGDTFTNVSIAFGGTSLWIRNNIDFVILIFMMFFTIIFGARKADATERHQGMLLALAVQSLIKLFAFLAVGIFVTFGLFDGFGDIFQRLEASDFSNLFSTTATDISFYMRWVSYLLMSMSAILFLPRQFHVAVVENPKEDHIRKVMWLLPLYLLLISIFVIPIAVGGLLQGYPSQEADTFVLDLPLRHGQPGLALLAFLGGLSAAMSMIMISSMTTATMVVNHLILPLISRIEEFAFLRRAFLRLRWAAIVGVLLLAYGFARATGNSYTLLNMGLISFCAVLQFAPAILGGLFWRRGNSKGAMLGLSFGFLLWGYTVFLPSFVYSGWLPLSFLEAGPLGIAWLKPEQLFGLTGLDPWSHAVFWTMLFNVGFYVLGSLYFEPQESEQQVADAFVDVFLTKESAIASYSALALESTVSLAEKVRNVKQLLLQYFGDTEVEEIVARALVSVDATDKTYVSLLELSEFFNAVETLLSGSLGAAVAHQAMRRANLFTELESYTLTSMYKDVLVDLRLSPEELRRRIDHYQERDQLLAQQAAELEERVLERTRDLEAASDVGRVVTSILDPDQLIQDVVELILERFSFYYVGLFLVDTDGEWAVLRAGTGSAGAAMLSRGHRIMVGEGMIGWCVAHAKARIALDVGGDDVRLATEELPLTRSEAALPLRGRDKVIGALTVQSSNPNAFGEDIIAVLQTMADQVAVALDNARLFSEGQNSLVAMQRAYGEVGMDMWAQMLRGRTEWGYFSHRGGVNSTEGEWPLDMRQAFESSEIVTMGEDAATVSFPVRARGQVVGALQFSKGEVAAGWSDEELELLVNLTDQLGMALESASLYANTQRRAARDRLSSEITSRIRESLNIDKVLQTAVREIGEVLDIAKVEVRMKPQ